MFDGRNVLGEIEPDVVWFLLVDFPVCDSSGIRTIKFLTCRVSSLPLPLVTDQIGRALCHARQTEAIVTDVARPAAVFLSNEKSDPVLYVRWGRRTGRRNTFWRTGVEGPVITRHNA